MTHTTRSIRWGATVAAATSLAVTPAAVGYQRPTTTEDVPIAGVSVNSGFAGIDCSGTSRWTTRDLSRLAYVTNDMPAVEERVAGVDSYRRGYVYDRRTKRTTLATVSWDGGTLLPNPAAVPAGSDLTLVDVRAVALSGRGGHFAFVSNALNVVRPEPAKTNGQGQVYLRDLANGTNELVSVTRSGKFADGFQAYTAVSPDGRYVAFTSTATDLLHGKDAQANVPHLYLRDRKTRTTILVNRSPSGGFGAIEGASKTNPVSPGAGSPVFTADGRFVFFRSNASNLVSDDTNDAQDVFRFEVARRRIVRVSLDEHGKEIEQASGLAGISQNGRYVLLQTLAPLTPTSNGGTYVRDLVTRRTERVSIDGAGAMVGAGGALGAVSDDGRYVVLPYPKHGPDGSRPKGIYAHDRVLGTTELVVADPSSGTYGCIAATPDARTVAFNRIEAPPAVGGVSPTTKHKITVHHRGGVIGVIGRPTATARGGRRTVSGSVAFSGVRVLSAVDPASDAVPLPSDRDELGGNAGQELTGADLFYRRESEDLLVRWRVAHMPRTFGPLTPVIGSLGQVIGQRQPTYGGSPYVYYRARLSVDGVPYEVQARTVGLGGQIPPQVQYTFALYNCQQSEVQCTFVRDLQGGLGTVHHEVRVSVPLAAFSKPAREGSQLGYFTAASVAVTTVASVRPLPDPPSTVLDQVAVQPVRTSVPRGTVTVTVTSPNTPGRSVTGRVHPAGGRFTWTFQEWPGAGGEYRYSVRACLGSFCGPAERF